MARQVQLRTGTAIIPPSREVFKIEPSNGLDSLAYRASSAWGEALALRIYLVAYDMEDETNTLEEELANGAPHCATDGSCLTRSTLASALTARHATILSYIPDATLLVAMRPQDAASLTAETGARMVEYGPEHRVAPELAPLLDEPAAAAAAASEDATDGAAAGQGSLKEKQQQHRRSLLKGAAGSALRSAGFDAAAGGDEAPGARAVLLGHMRPFDPRAVPGGAAHDQRRRRLVEGRALPPPMYELRVELLPGLSKAALAAAAADWPAALAAAAATAQRGAAAAGACLPIVTAPASVEAPDASGVCTSDCWLHVFLCDADLAAGIRWLAAQPVVRWVAPGLRVRHHSATSSVLLQTGDLTLTQYLNPVGTAADEPVNRPYRAAGLDGTGEIVGVGDTGLDLDSCYFADPRINATTYSSLMTGTPPRYRPADHRKLVQYYMITSAVFGDDPSVEWGSGHGTHIAGSVGGAILAGSDPYGPYVTDAATGAAPRAKLSIVDMNIPGTMTASELYYKETFITPPTPLDTAYLPLHTAVNASIISDSWGAQVNVYDANAQAYDRFLWNNPNVVSFVAAGNNGTQALTPGGTVASPASAKNVVAVGQGEKVPAVANTSRAAVVVRAFAPGNSTEAWRLSMWPLEAPFQNKLLDVLPPDALIPFVLAEPAEACTNLTNPPETLLGSVVLVKRGTCLFTTKGQNVLAAGGIAMVIANNVALMMTDPPVAPQGTMMPVSAITKGLGDLLLGNITLGLQLFVSDLQVPLSITSVSVSSSYGPMTDGRIKPDIIVPGTSIVSAAAEGGVTANTCSTTQRNLTGTSMATPQAAGHAALIRQYFRTGFYPAGTSASNTSAPFTPSGMLIKAVVIAGARSLKNGIAHSMGTSMGAGPDGFQGWGRLSLAGALPLANYGDSRVRLQLADRGSFNATKQAVSFTGLSATGTGPVTIVLTWYDYPADLNAAVQLVNDLDLLVNVGATATSTAYNVYGNNVERTAPVVIDRKNTVERVLLAAPRAGAPLNITVSCFRLGSATLSTLPQRFALAVVGHVSGTLASPLNPDWAAQRAAGIV